MGLFSPFMDDEDDEQKPPRIARPDSGLGIPPVSLRGVTPKPEPIQQAAKAESVPQPKPDLPLAQPDKPPSQTDTDRAELGRLTSTGSGITQIKNPWARNSLRGLNIAGEVASAVLPQVGTALRAIPGTEEHHNKLVGRATGRLNEDIKGDQEQAQTAHTEAETGAIPSQIEHTQAETNALDNPQPKPKEESYKPYPNFTDADGTPLKIEETSGKVLRADGGVPTGFKAAKAEAPFQTDKTVRIINGVPHEVLIDKQTGADVKDLGQTKVPGESSADKRAANEQAQVEREARMNIRKAEGQYRDTEKSVAQLSAAIDASKDGNGLLTSFVPTMEVLGINAANGVHRISPVEAHAANLPGGWAEQFNAWFDKASTGQLTPQLQAEGKQLAHILLKTAHDRYASTYKDESGIVEGYGGKDFGKRVPMIPGQDGGGPAVGTVEGGYRFKGGDAGNPNSWERVQ